MNGEERGFSYRQNGFSTERIKDLRERGDVKNIIRRIERAGWDNG